MMYRCPCCDCNKFTFYIALRQRIENKTSDQSTSIYAVMIDCCKCGETIAEKDFVVTKKFGEKVRGDEVYEIGKKYFEDWKHENNEQMLREINPFNNCPSCRTSLYVSLERNFHVYEDGTRDLFYRTVCHKCSRATQDCLDPGIAIESWNKLSPMEEEGMNTF